MESQAMDSLLYETEISSKRERTKKVQLKSIVKNNNFEMNESLKKKLLKDVGAGAFGYFQSMPFIFNLKVLYISPSRHYFYQPSEFSDIDVVINLRLINTIADLNHYMENITQILPFGGYYIGSFKDYKSELKNKKGFPGYKMLLRTVFRLNNRLIALMPGIRQFYYFLDCDYVQPLSLKDLKRHFRHYGFSFVNVHHHESGYYFLLTRVNQESEEFSFMRLFRKKKKTMIIEL